MNPILIRQGGLRFHWDRKRDIVVQSPDGTQVDRFLVGAVGADKATLDEVHDAIDAFVEERKQ